MTAATPPDGLVVVDASALIDGYREDQPPWHGTMLHLRGRYRLAAPALLSWEVGNVVLRSRSASGAGGTDRPIAFVESLLEGIELVAPDAEARASTARIVARHGLTFHDAAYLDLAERAGGTLLSMDGDLLRAAATALSAERALDLPRASRAVAAGLL